MEARGGDGEEQRKVELKKFSLRPEKYDVKGDFDGWVNQFKEYAAPVLVPNRRGTNVFHWTAGVGEDGKRHQGRGSRSSVPPGDGHQHRVTRVGWTQEGEEPVAQLAGR